MLKLLILRFDKQKMRQNIVYFFLKIKLLTFYYKFCVDSLKKLVIIINQNQNNYELKNCF